MPFRIGDKCYRNRGFGIEEVPCRDAPSPQEPEGLDVEDLLRTWLEDQEAAAEEAAAAAEGDGRAEDISATGRRETRGEGEREITGTTTREVDEFIKQITRVYIDVPTPEEFLDDFGNALAGYSQDMVEAGMSQGDINLMLDPTSGFMQTMLNEYMGNLAQRAAAGEDIFEVAGVGGEEQLLGTRTGEVTQQDITRMTRTRAEEVLRESGEQVTEETIQRIIDEDTQRQQETITETTDQVTRETRDETVTETGERTFEETEVLISRPRLTPVYKFSPTDFLKERFGDDIGQLTAQVRGRKGERGRIAQTATGGVAVSARRA